MRSERRASCLDVFDHPALVEFEEAEGKIRVNTIDKPAEYVSKDKYESMGREEYIEWFLAIRTNEG